MNTSKFYQKDGNPQIILKNIIEHKKKSTQPKRTQKRFPQGFAVFPTGEGPVMTAGVASAVENAVKREDKFMTFLESLKCRKK